MANATRQSFRPTQTGMMDLPTGDLPERVSIDLNDKDANNYTVIEVDDRSDDEIAHGNSDPSTWNDANSEDPKGSPRTEKRIARLKAEGEAHKRIAEATQRERDAALEAARLAAAEVADLKARLSSGTTALATSMKGEREAKLADAERRLAQAHADGDSTAIAAATRDMGQAQAELVAINANAPRQQVAPAAQTQQPQPAAQPAARLHPNAQSWIDRNPQFNTDQSFRSKALGIHWMLDAEGIKPDSPKYAEELDRRMETGYQSNKPNSGSRDDGANPQPRRTNAVAEGSREASRQPNPRIVELTASQLAIAKQLGLTAQQYAASLVKYDKQNGAR